MRSITTLSAHLLLLAGSAIAAHAALLTGTSGTITLPGSTGLPATNPGVPATLTTVGPNHTGTWATPAATPWVGTYNGTGPIPGSASSSPSTLDFTPLPLGYLPALTFVVFSDLDSSERLTLRGFDASGGLLTSHWLNDAVHLSGSNSLEFVQSFMPSWAFDNTTGTYEFTGELASGNPLLGLYLTTAANLSRIELTKDASFGFFLNAPTSVPEPGTWALTALGLLAASAIRRR